MRDYQQPPRPWGKSGVCSYFRLPRMSWRPSLWTASEEKLAFNSEETPHLRQVVGSEVWMQGQTGLTPGLVFCCSAGKRGLPLPPDCESIPKGCGADRGDSLHPDRRPEGGP